eukprot:GHVU01093724.1.p1 GENE.GHVU01093724.1~~GHVU01093724.1.p1  ORF type:complete len:222 (+),score=20.12 GHVU01093724.1:571-1236(+)
MEDITAANLHDLELIEVCYPHAHALTRHAYVTTERKLQYPANHPCNSTPASASAFTEEKTKKVEGGSGPHQQMHAGLMKELYALYRESGSLNSNQQEHYIDLKGLITYFVDMKKRRVWEQEWNVIRMVPKEDLVKFSAGNTKHKPRFIMMPHTKKYDSIAVFDENGKLNENIEGLKITRAELRRISQGDTEYTIPGRNRDQLQYLGTWIPNTMFFRITSVQ